MLYYNSNQKTNRDCIITISLSLNYKIKMTDKEINKEIGDYFLSDAKEFLKRYDILVESATNFGLRMKLVCELLFSLECALKALFLYETNLEPKKTYETIKKFSHNIDKIIKKLSQENKKEVKSILKTNYKDYQVFHRYTFESVCFLRNNTVLDEKYYTNIVNDIILKKQFYEEIKELIKHVEDISDQQNSSIETIVSEDIDYHEDNSIETIAFEDIDYHKETQKYQKLEDISKNSNYKKNKTTIIHKIFRFFKKSISLR